jgi:hypothetical protein
MSAKSGLVVAGALALLLTCAATARIPGIHWLVGYGHESDYSFHPDDERFILSAKDFQNKLAAKRDGYPLFMVTQLFAINKFLQEILHVEFNSVVVLRCISLAYGLGSILLLYVFVVSLGFSRLVGLLASFFLAFAPLHIISSHFGTADMTALLLFYMTIFAAWRYRVSCQEPWLYAAIALAGVAMANKFFLPALVAPAMIVLFQSSGKMWSRFFVSACIFTTFFCAASFFNFTPWDFRHLVDMLRDENLVVEGGKSPLQQIVLYSWDIIPCSGVVTSTLAFIGCLVLCRRVGVSRIGNAMDVLTKRQNILSYLPHTFLNWLRTPASILIVPLAFYFLLIVTAQVHFSRHILTLIPVICFLAAIASEGIFKWLQSAPLLVQSGGIAAILALLAVQLVDGLVTDKVYPADIRINLAEFLYENGFAHETETFFSYTYLKDVLHLPIFSDRIPTAPVFISCDIEYARYISAGQGIPTFHVFGGKARTDFYMSLFNGTADHIPVFHVKRKRESLEDRLAGEGWVPELDTYVPNECYAFKRTW